MKSYLEIFNLSTNERRVIFETNDHIEAPNWTCCGKFLIYNSYGHLYKIPVEGGIPQLIDTRIC